ncbi:MAG: MscL family protein [Patescibacteria group bacterium]|uniref:MscL family protein n=1 Tax=candidate division WWE3 bacterium TaxID=2053526 RepID=A0A955J2T9_UNCKA|nr:MscL family protein [candidate division WWE3 bacterium]
MKKFIEFIREQGVVGLAVGFILGGSVSKVVTALVEDIINPLVGILLGKVGNLSNMVLVLGNSVISYGHFVSVLVDFVIVAAVVYYIFRGLGFDKLDKKS